MNKKDMYILSQLRTDSRMRLTKMSRITRIPVSTLYDRIRLQQGKLIQKHTSIIDFNKLGFNARAKIMLKVKQDQRELLKEYLLMHQNINSVYKINNGYDFLAEAVFRNLQELDCFIEALDEKFKIEQKDSYHIIDDIKREGFLSDQKTVELL